ncbi:hypothetical protein [Nitrososphaera sp. AFS]|uniref:hypothetical protein n=1 Tax=Nitrososphaera sp. AFS TaxID=2301191 RepID=UPI0013923E96|nr:hypothetical protein [Nitrososphaera sp. AFS]NAL77821.1 hypothetical protein [Nitrososphaera sp. AFS]
MLGLSTLGGLDLHISVSVILAALKQLRSRRTEGDLRQTQKKSSDSIKQHWGINARPNPCCKEFQSSIAIQPEPYPFEVVSG